MPFTVLDSSTAEAAPVLNIGAPLDDNGMSLQDFRDELIFQLSNRADLTPGGLYTRVDRWINWGYTQVCSILDLKELWASFPLTTVASQPFYGMPRALSWIKKLSIDDPTWLMETGGEELAMIDVDTFRGLPDSSELDWTPLLPESYFRYVRMLVLWPTPDAAYDLAVDCRIRPLPLTDELDCPLLPDEYHEAILYAAKSRAWRALNNPGQAAVANNDMLGVLRPLINSDGEERAAMHATLTPVRSRRQLYRGRI